MRNVLLFAFTVILISNAIAQEKVLTQKLLNQDQRPEGKFTAYESKNGALYRIGDKITIGVPSSNKTFAFIIEGDGVIMPVTNVDASASGHQAEIKKIWVHGTKRSGYYATFRCKGFTGLSNYNVRIENAIATGEVDGFGMTSDEALTELKNAKDKLDLGVITQSQYDSIKADLIKYIN